MRKRYETIFFDLDNTLWDFKTNSKFALKKVFDDFVGSEAQVDFREFDIAYNKNNDALWSAYRKKEVQKKELIRLRFQQTLEEFGINKIDALEMNAAYLNEMPKQTNLMEGAIEVLEYLKTKKYALHIITNGFSEVQHRKLQNSQLAPYFDKIFTSEGVKAPKPSREIFEYAIKSTNAKKAKSIMIGDAWDVDVLGASTFGMDAIHLDSSASGSIVNNSFKNVIYTIQSLNELTSIL